jgi:hypothetical protein
MEIVTRVTWTEVTIVHLLRLAFNKIQYFCLLLYIKAATAPQILVCS